MPKYISRLKSLLGIIPCKKLMFCTKMYVPAISTLRVVVHEKAWKSVHNSDSKSAAELAGSG